MKPQDSFKCALLLIGFNRPELIQRRLNEIGYPPTIPVIVSIDGGITAANEETYKQLQASLSESSYHFKYHSTNLGLATHITRAISEVLENFENVIVIEDDVKVSRSFIEVLESNLSKSNSPRIATWGGFSPIRPIQYLEKFNYWRSSIYFSAWGWGISRNAWKKFNLDLNLDLIELEQQLQSSKNWAKLNAIQKRVWRSRFKKVSDSPLFTWDYQMQFMSFKYDLIHMLPIFRLTDNEGFEDLRSTNTKSRRPKWMGKVAIAKLAADNKRLPAIFARIIMTIDSLTIGGDSRVLIWKSRILKNWLNK